MLDQNLLDKQYILESLIDLLEKNTINNSTGHTGGVLSNVTNQQPSSSATQNRGSAVNCAPLLNEFPTVKLILNTSKIKQFLLAYIAKQISNQNLCFQNTVFQNMYHFLQSELLSRRLAYYCAKRISLIFGEYSNVFFDKAVRQLKAKVSSTAKPGNGNSVNGGDDTNAPSPASPSSNNELTINYILKQEIPLNSVIKKLSR
jgi:hypothetical protein